MQTSKTPVNKQAALLISGKRRCETMQEAIEMTINHLLKGKLNERLSEAFLGDFGSEPWVTFQITIRRDPKTPGAFAFKMNTKIGHEIDEPVNLYGLKP